MRTGNTDKESKPNTALSNFSQKVLWLVMLDIFIFTRFPLLKSILSIPLNTFNIIVFNILTNIVIDTQ